MIGNVDTFRFVNIPSGLIVPWGSSGAAPTGWSLLTPPNTGVLGFSGCYIVGAGSSYTVGQSGIGGSPAGWVNFNTTSTATADDGYHLGTAFTTYTGSAVSGPAYAGGGYGGNHPHKVNVSPILGYNQYQLIKANSTVEKFPAKSILLNTTYTSIPWLTAGLTNNRYLRAGNSQSTADTSSSQTLDNGGDHDHNWTTYTDPIYGDNDYTRIQGNAGTHIHNFVSVIITDYIKKVYTTAWTYASDFYGFTGMIGFWDGAIGTIPIGWQICNGTNGTIDMRDYFPVFGTSVNMGTKTGTNIIDVGPTAGQNLLDNATFLHDHSEPWVCTIASSTARNAYHESYSLSHHHPNSKGTGLSFYPQFCALYIIQKL